MATGREPRLNNDDDDDDDDDDAYVRHCYSLPEGGRFL